MRDGDLDLAVIDGREMVAQAEPDEQLSLLAQAASRAARAQDTLQGAGVPTRRDPGRPSPLPRCRCAASSRSARGTPAPSGRSPPWPCSCSTAS